MMLLLLLMRMIMIMLLFRTSENFLFTSVCDIDIDIVSVDNVRVTHCIRSTTAARQLPRMTLAGSTVRANFRARRVVRSKIKVTRLTRCCLTIYQFYVQVRKMPRSSEFT